MSDDKAKLLKDLSEVKQTRDTADDLFEQWVRAVGDFRLSLFNAIAPAAEQGAVAVMDCLMAISREGVAFKYEDVSLVLESHGYGLASDLLYDAEAAATQGVTSEQFARDWLARFAQDPRVTIRQDHFNAYEKWQRQVQAIEARGGTAYLWGTSVSDKPVEQYRPPGPVLDGKRG